MTDTRVLPPDDLLTAVLPADVLTPGPAAQPTLAGTGRPAPVIPGYEVGELVGRGGFAEVFRGRQLALDRVVAVKVIDPGAGGDPRAVARVRTEAVALARFQHPNIVPVYDFGPAGDRLFIAMELLVGEDLGGRLARVGRLDEATGWQVVRQAAAGLAHAAAHGVVHRDVKPANLFLLDPPAGANLPVVKVTDFGLARARWAVDDSAQPVTAPGSALGTPAYMAPEQHDGAGAVDHRADVYGLGATAYHALTGRRPFAGATIWEVLANKAAGPLPAPELSAESEALLRAMLARDPADRVQTYAELLARIDALPAVAGTPTRPRRRLPRRWPAAVAAGLVAAGGWAAWPRPAVPAVYRPADDPVPLFNHRGLDNWHPEGGGWGLATDDERATVLEGSGRTRLRLRPFPDYRLVVGLDVRGAAAEVRVGRAAGPLFVVRVVPGVGATFGRRATPAGEFEPLGPAVPAADRLNGRPYREVRIERTNGRWAAWFDGRPVGQAADGGRPEPAAWLVAEGGPVRADTAELTPLEPAP